MRSIPVYSQFLMPSSPYAAHGPSHLSIREQRPVHEQSQLFTTRLAMLLYNVCYLAHIQRVKIPLSQASDALRTLWTVCCSGELGQ